LDTQDGQPQPPDPLDAVDLDDLVATLRMLREWAGTPSYAQIAQRIGSIRAGRGGGPDIRRPSRATVYDCFRLGRARMDVDLLTDVVRALGVSGKGSLAWRQAYGRVMGAAAAASVVTARSSLPAPSPHVVARDAALGTLLQAMRAEGESVVLIEGRAGSGKSELAITAARHLLHDGHVEGVLHADLRGFHPDNPPADPAAVLEAFLRILDVPGWQVQASLKQRQALLTERLRSRRHVVVLDDASSTRQVVPLIPRGVSTVVLITSRTRLDDVPGAVRVPLSVFTRDEALTLLRQVAGEERVDADLATATELVEASGCLPLAVGLTAARVAARPDWMLADHLEPLLTRRRGLRLDDAVQATLDLSYAALAPSAQSTLRMLAVHPCPDLDVSAIAALTGRDTDTIEHDLSLLETHHFVSQPRAHHYSLHALVQIHALDRSYDEDRPAERDAALNRLCEHVVAMVWAAYESLSTAAGHHNRRVPPLAALPDLDESTAGSWLLSNVENFLTLAHRGAELDNPRLPILLSEGAAWWLNWRGRYREAQFLHQLALDNARSLGDLDAEAVAALDLGQSLAQLNEFDAAADQLLHAAQTFTAIGDPGLAGVAMSGLAVIDARCGRLSASIDRFHQAIEVLRGQDDPHRLASTLGNLAVAYRQAGRLTEAVTHNQMALAEADKAGDRLMRSNTLANLSELHLQQGSPGKALHSAREARELAREIGYPQGLVIADINIGDALCAGGDHDEAVGYYEDALKLSRDMGARRFEADVLNGLGSALRRLGNHERARSHLDEAHKVAKEISDSFQQARALDGLGAVLAAEGAVDDARQMWREALDLYGEPDLPEAENLRARLARLSSAH
jgi:tetratricopeptide (TPR) repeat protein